MVSNKIKGVFKVKREGSRPEKDIEGLIEALNNKSWFVRRKAAEALGKIGDKRAIDPLINALNDDDIEVREEIVTSLGKIGDKKAVDQLIYILEKDKEDVRWKAARALGDIGDKKAVEPLILSLNDEYYAVRLSAVRSLGQIKDKRAVEPLIKMLDDEIVEVQKEAAIALEKIGDERAMKSMESLSDQNLIKELDKENKMISKDVNEAIEWHKKAIGFSENREYEKAIECYNKALELDPDYINPWFDKGLAFIGLKKYHKAIRCFEEFKRLAPPELKSFVKKADDFIGAIKRELGVEIDGFDKDKSTSAILTLEKDGIKLHWKGTFTGRDKGDQFIRYGDITSIAFKKGLIQGKIELRFPGGDIKLGHINKKDGIKFVSNVQDRIKSIKYEPEEMKKTSAMDEIRKAKELLDMDAITKEEFAKIKRKYLE